MWEYKVTSVSSVDVNGSFEFTYDILFDNEIIYPNLGSSATTKDQAVQIIMQKMTELKTSVDEAHSLKVGDTGTL